MSKVCITVGVAGFPLTVLVADEGDWKYDLGCEHLPARLIIRPSGGGDNDPGMRAGRWEFPLAAVSYVYVRRLHCDCEPCASFHDETCQLHPSQPMGSEL